jgi:hypothetical protein
MTTSERKIPTKKRLNKTRQNMPPDSVLVQKTYLQIVSVYLMTNNEEDPSSLDSGHLQ